MLVKFIRSHTHARVDYRAGDKLETDDETARLIVEEFKAAEYVSAQDSAPVIPAKKKKTN
ncbi:hypothetical protein HZB60_04165 [candidate division KSB1 bacterium]|nr:hypothetical protein [candidate division KSB1 bacterium]